jgi:hypothetical protein
MTLSDRAFLRERRCYVCLRIIPETLGCHWGHFIVCMPGCHAVAVAKERNFSHSKRGKRRPLPEFLALLRAMRPRVAVQ